MEVLGVRRSLRPEDEVDPFAEVHANERLHDLLPRADILLITLPDTPETRGLIGAPELELLPEGSVLVNVGRATVVDEEALYTALKSEGWQRPGSTCGTATRGRRPNAPRPHRLGFPSMNLIV